MKLSLMTIAPAVAAAVLAGGIGYTVGDTDPKDSPEFRHAQDVIDEKNQGLEDAVDALEQAGADIETIQGDLPDREAALQSATEELDTRAADVTQAEKDAQAKLADVQRRERAVGIVETEIANNTIPGGGTYRVGTDMKAGTYRSVDNAQCYWQLSSDANGADIINNAFVESGPALVTASDGQYFQTQTCSDWVLQP